MVLPLIQLPSHISAECIVCRDSQSTEPLFAHPPQTKDTAYHPTHLGCLKNWAESKRSVRIIPCVLCESGIDVRSLFAKQDPSLTKFFFKYASAGALLLGATRLATSAINWNFRITSAIISIVGVAKEGECSRLGPFVGLTCGALLDSALLELSTSTRIISELAAAFLISGVVAIHHRRGGR